MKRAAVAMVLAALSTVVSGALAAPPVSALQAGLRTGHYACMVIDPYSGLLETKYNVKILGKGKYQYARFATGNKLDNPKTGKYSATSKKIVFKTGPMKSRYGKLHRTGGTPTISIYTKRPNKDTYVDCYRQ